MQLRISDDENPVLWARFDGASGTLALLDASGHQVGKASLPGRRQRLQAKDATLYLRGSDVVGSGPAGQSVTLTLDLSFARRLAGRRLQVEVLATGPAGFEQLDTEPVGTLTVVR